jgi:hypothetical protein
MNKSFNKLLVIATVSLVISLSLIQPSVAETTVDTTSKDKLPTFLSTVIGFDMTEYMITNNGYSSSFPSNYGGSVKQEIVSFTLQSTTGSIDVMGIFYNGYIYGISILPHDQSMVYSEQQSVNRLTASRNILHNYESFVQKYMLGTSHISEALNILDRVVDVKDQNVTSGNMKLLMTDSLYRVADQSTSHTSFNFVYSTDNFDVNNKCLSIDFNGNQLTFRDTWDLYTVEGSTISKAEATAIAWNSAKNYNVTLIGSDNSSTTVQPDWTNMYSTIELNLISGQIYNDSLNEALNFASMGSKVRDPLTLYPLWQSVFYFSRSIGGAVGIQVGVWGDTEELAYCTTYGYLDNPGTTPTASASATNVSQSLVSSNWLTNNAPVVGVLISAATMLAVGLLLLRRRKN